MANRHVTHTQRRAAARILASDARLVKLAAGTARVSLATVYRWRVDPEFLLLVHEERAKLRRHERAGIAVE